MDDTNRRPAEATASNGAIGNVIDSLNNACGQVKPHGFDNIPFEMKTFSQWVTWRYEAGSEGKKPTKVLRSPHYDGHAAVDKPSTWGTFEAAKRKYEAGGEAGIGFVLTDSDPYVFTDLDDSSGQTDHSEILERQNRIYDASTSYAERSPSGVGCHIIAKGSVPRGVKRSQVEIYSQLRFMTMTGDVLRDAPIVDEHELVNMLWYAMAEKDASPDNGIDGPQTLSDEQTLAKMFGLSNGKKAADLYNGVWASYFPTQSEADFALINILQFSSGNRAQTDRLFRGAPSYRPTKYDNRPDLISHMIARSFDRVIPVADHTPIIDQLKAIVDAAKVAPNMPGTSAPNDDLLPIVYASSLHEKPIVRRSWHVADMIPARTVTLFSGDGGTGKSLAALQLAFATAYAQPWLGSAVRHGPCLFVTAEDEFDDAHSRLADISTGTGVSLASGRHPLAISSLAGCDALLAVPVDRSGVLMATDLCKALATYIDANRPALVVLDTLSDLFGGEENNRSQVRQFVSMLRGITIMFDTTILLLSHPSVAGMSNGSGLSGSTAWNNSVRSRLYLETVDGEPSMRTMSVKKSNYGAVGGVVKMEWRSGYFVEVGRAANASAHKMEKEASIEDLFSSLLAEFTERGQTLSRVPQSIHYAPKLFANNSKSQGYSKSQFAEAMYRLTSSGRIKDGKSDQPQSRAKDIIVLGNAV